MDDPLRDVPRPRARTGLADRARAWLEWFGIPRLMAIAAATCLVGAGGYWLLRTPPAPVERSLPFTGAATTTSPTAVAATPATPPASTGGVTWVVVHVAGAVAHPEVYRLPAGARVVDAVNAAGGLDVAADLATVNLAAPVRDGERVFVPAVGETVPPIVVPDPRAPPGGPSGPGDVAAGPVDLNRAGADQLDALPGIGPATAAAIIAHREQHGPFVTVDDLADVRGIGPAKVEALRGLVTT